MWAKVISKHYKVSLTLAGLQLQFSGDGTGIKDRETFKVLYLDNAESVRRYLL